VKEISTKPYLIRALHEWCTDSDLTPYLTVKIDSQTRVPIEYADNGEITLNISHGSAHHLKMDNDVINFSARFNGVSREVSIPMTAVMGIFGKETGQGMLFNFEPETTSIQVETNSHESSIGLQPSLPPPKTTKRGKLRLKIIK
jgi:stringent starvation protein B